MTSLRILLADDHEVVRQGLRAILLTQPDWSICGEAANGREAVEKAIALRPAVVILDLSMPELNGLEAAKQIHLAAPQIEVLVLTMHESEALVRQLFAAGARGYLLKSDAGKDLVRAVEQLSQHKLFFSSQIAGFILDGYIHPQTPAGTPMATLTPREQEVVRLIAEGRSSKEIAEKLGISLKTAEVHRAHLMRKLDLHSVSELVRYAIRNGIIVA